MAAGEISEDKLQRATWKNLRRLARSLGIEAPDILPEQYRQGLIDEIARTIGELRWMDAYRRRKTKRPEPIRINDSRASST